MEQFFLSVLFFAVALVGFAAALKFSKYKNEKPKNDCEKEEDCIIKKLGIKTLQCNH